MVDGQGPTTTRRRLRFELRRLREEMGLLQGDVAARLDWSQSKLVRIENGSVGISVTDLRALLNVYRAPEETVDDLVELARNARGRRWWSQYRDLLKPAYQEFIGFEEEATRLRQYHATMVPGLLQTEAYMRALIPALVLSPSPESRYEALVQVRLHRQREIVFSDSPTDLEVLIDEAALRRPVGGTATMHAQLSHIAEAQGRAAVSVAVLPFSAGPHVGMAGPFHIIEFAAEADDDVLYLETAQGDMAFRDQPDLVAQYSKCLDRMLDLSLRGDAAVDFLRTLADESA